MFGESIDALDGVVERITAVLERQTDYVHQHTNICNYSAPTGLIIIAFQTPQVLKGRKFLGRCPRL
ncbi:MAG: hypothetical protein DRR19_15170 [Candidatus Parabeggiatoa sp. nov. 1]|nr:MAG: hypothetical protein DRR19_15170 [Gammaproteobacteria bacterium]